MASTALGNAAGWLARRDSLQNPSAPLYQALTQYFSGPPNVSGYSVSEKGSLGNMAVWRAVNLLAGTAAMLPLKLYRNLPDGTRREITDHPLFTGEAYPDLTWYEYIETTVLHVLLYGNAYSLLIRNEAGDRLVRVLPIAPDRVDVRRVPQSERNPSGKEFVLSQVDGDREALTPAEIMHVPGLCYDGLKGLSPIQAARQALGVAGAAEHVAAKLFDSGLFHAGFIQANVELDDEQAEQVKDRWRSKVAGLARSYEPVMLSNGLTYTPASIPPREAQWIEARQFGIQEVARLYGVPADMLMDNSATGNTNVEQRATAFIKFGFGALLRRLEKRMSFHLAPRATFVEFSLDALLRGDTAVRGAYYAQALAGGWMTVNEIRALENLPPLPDEAPGAEEEEEPPAPLAPVPDEDDEEEEDGGTASAAA